MDSFIENSLPPEDKQPIPESHPGQTMAEAIAAFSTAVIQLPDGSLERIHSTPNEESAPYTIDTRFIDGQAYLCAIAVDGSIIYKRGQGSVSSPELYSLVESEAQRILSKNDS